MKLPRIFSVLAAFAMLLSGMLAAVHAQTTSTPLTPAQIAKMPVVALPIKDFKLLTSGTGWASTGGRLLLTTDNGAHWKDISPPTPAPSNPNENRFGDVFFLDTQAGWVISAGDLQESSPDSDETETVLFLTVDGGATWAVVILPRLKPLQKVGGVNFTFADRLHGWLMIQHQSGPAFSFSSLYSTLDGGRTWHEVKGRGFYGNIRAFPNGEIWVTGDHGANDEGKAQELVVSRDGGNSFEEISLDAPKEIAPADDPTYGLPVFEDNLHGFEAVTYSGGNGDKSAEVLFATEDGGRTWKPDRILSNLDESSVGRLMFSAVAGTTWIHSFAPMGTQTTLVRLHSNDRIKATVNERGRDGFNNCELSFLTPDEGWMNCSGNLTSTTDGGSTWTAIAPRVRNGVLTTDPVTPTPTSKPLKTIQIKPPVGKSGAAVVPRDTSPGHIGYVSGIDQHLGFDKDLILSTGDMATWWASSPYYDVGIYLPHSPSGPVTPTLTSDWVDAVIGQGWGIIPIWSGLQPPCTVEPHKHTFSAVPDKAYKQGVGQAVKAYTSANALGLDGTIIYVDLEEYDHSVCGAAVKKYVKGWVEEMHTLGGSGSAGVYGNQDVAALDLTAADDGYITYADKHVTVWGLNHYSGSGLTDTLAWTNKQRIHQYRIKTKKDPALETWGGAGPYNIDEDIVDATVVQSSGTKHYNFLSPVTVSADGWPAGINNGVNNGTGLQTGTVLNYDSDNGTIYTYSPTAGTTIIPLPFTVWPQNPIGINNIGQIVGSYYDSSYVPHGFLYTPGAKSPLTILDVPGLSVDDNIWFTSINDAGWIVGLYNSEGDGWGDNHCLLYKPPYNYPILFDSFGGVGCGSNCPPNEPCGAITTIFRSGPEINGLGQIAFATEVGPNIDTDEYNWSQVFIDDVEAGTPGPSDNVLTMATTQVDQIYDVSGINNNGQIAGQFWDLSGSEEDNIYVSYGGFFMNTYGSFIQLPLQDGGTITGLNDDVQLAGWDDSGGIIIDTQH